MALRLVRAQNAAALASIGVHGMDQLLNHIPGEALPVYTQKHDLNFLLELLGSQQVRGVKHGFGLPFLSCWAPSR